jgi:choline monooxygenase
MKIEAQRELVKRMLRLLDERTTEMADEFYELETTAYTSRKWWDREQNVLFGSDYPLLVGLSSEYRKAGAYRALNLANTPVLLTRAEDGEMRAMLNACRHRGMQVAQGSGGGARRFSCPFHGWSYAVDGSLLGITDRDGFAGVFQQERGLIQLPVAERHGLIFVAPRPGRPIDVDIHLSGMAAEIQTYELGDWTPIAEPHVHRIAANWKIALDTFAENYHFAYLHRDTLSTFAYGNLSTFDAYGRHLRNVSAQRSIDELRAQPDDEWVPLRHLAMQYRIFPNSVLTVVEKQVQLFQLFPGATPDASYGVHTTYAPGSPDQDERAELAKRSDYVCQTVIENQDFWAAGQIQPAIATGVLPTVLFGRNEPGLHHLHTGIREMIWAEAPAR